MIAACLVVQLLPAEVFLPGANFKMVFDMV